MRFLASCAALVALSAAPPAPAQQSVPVRNGTPVAPQGVPVPQRVRALRQGPDGLLYLLTGEDDGVILRIEPAN